MLVCSGVIRTAADEVGTEVTTSWVGVGCHLLDGVGTASSKSLESKRGERESLNTVTDS